MIYRQPFTGSYPISQYFGEKYTDPCGHTGIDYACPTGTEILASADGTVTFVGNLDTGYGKYIRIQHPDGNVTLYAHLSKVFVREGQNVKQGQVIGLSGSTGNSTGPHLHFEMRGSDGEPFDPMESLHSFADISDQSDTEQTNAILPEGIYRVCCEVAWIRNWKNIQRSYTVNKGELIYIFPLVKWYDGLPFRFIGAGRCIAQYDWEGTKMIEKVNDDSIYMAE